MTQPNYNDGSWHGWNGGECLVHPKTEVEVITISRAGTFPTERARRLAGEINWGGNNVVTIICFRVTKEHKEPREWLVALGVHGDIVESSATDSGFFKANYPDAIHVREVIDGDDT